MRLYLFLIAVFVCLFTYTVNAQSPGYNIGFEVTAPGSYTTANAVNEWTISSGTNTICSNSASWTPGSPEFSIITTPTSLTPIGTIPHSPFGGTCIAQLNNTSGNSNTTKIAYDFYVTNQNFHFAFAYCMVQQNGGHDCCEQPNLEIRLLDSLGIPLPCYQMSVTAVGAGCPSGAVGYSYTSGSSWTNWVVKQINLQSFIGSKIKFEATIKDCICGQHFGTTLLDAMFVPVFNGCSGFPLEAYGHEVSFCPGATVATIQGPDINYYTYYNYPWQTPYGTVYTTTNVLSVPFPSVGMVFTLNVGYCQIPVTYTLVHTQIKIRSICSAYSCAGGTAGSASVLATGNGGTYTYTWVNSTNSVVGSTQIINNLPPGGYTVFVAGPNGCGTASASTVVYNGVNHSTEEKINCLGKITNLAPPAGTNYQWYIEGSAISSTLGGTSSTFTLTHPGTYSYVTVSYTSSATHCRDSLTYIIKPTIKGSISIYTTIACTGSANATANLYINPTWGSPPSGFSYSVTNLPNTASYSAVVTGTSFGTHNIQGLAGGSYSLNATDGLCDYNATFHIMNINLQVSVYAPGVICKKDTATVSFVSAFNPLTFTWTPSTWVIGNPANKTSVQLFPNMAIGTQSSITYSVDIKHVYTGCAKQYTFTINAATPISPTILPVPPMCYNAPVYTIQAFPSGGYFTGKGVDYSGNLYPQYTNNQFQPITYNYSQFSCQSNSTILVEIQPLPVLSILTNTLICSGTSAMISLDGASNYTWTNGQMNTPIIVTPTTTSSYSVTGSHTLNTCINSTFITVYVTPSPKLKLPTDTFLCRPDVNMLLSSPGAQSYSWSTGSTSYSVIVAPPVPAIYSVVATNQPGNCRDTVIINVHISAKPYLNVADSFRICKGEEVYISVYGSDGYYWNGSPGTSTFSAKPSFNTVYQLVGSNQTGVCFEKKNITVIVDECLSTLNDSNSHYKIFPNPFSNSLTLEVNSSATYSISDAFGRPIQKGTIDQENQIIDTKFFSAGIYFLEIQTVSHKSVRKIIRN